MFSEEFLMDLGIATLGAGIVGAIAVLFGVLKGWQPLLHRPQFAYANCSFKK